MTGQGSKNALDLLNGPIMGATDFGFPSLSGGDAAPSFAQSSVGSEVIFSNAFSVAGGDANATASPATQKSTNQDEMLKYAFLGILAVVAFKMVKK